MAMVEIAERGTQNASGRATATRRTLLDAACDVFTTAGYAAANVTEVVSRAGASVGSLYHHFGGKAELYLTLFDEYQRRQEERTGSAIRRARDGGETDPVRLFIVGARAYLDGCLAEPSLSRVFMGGDGPPGFEVTVRRRLREWTRRNAALLQARDEPFDEALVLVLTSATAGAVAEVSTSDDETRARRLAEESLAVIARLAAPREDRRE